jgi:hypothetical protein
MDDRWMNVCADFPPRLGLFLSLFVAKVFLSGREIKPASQSASDTLGHKHTHIAAGVVVVVVMWTRRFRCKIIFSRLGILSQFLKKISRTNSLFSLIFLVIFCANFAQFYLVL